MGEVNRKCQYLELWNKGGRKREGRKGLCRGPGPPDCESARYPSSHPAPYKLADSKFRDASEILVLELLVIKMDVDVNRIRADISSELLDHLPWHPVPPQVGCEPVAEAMRREMVLQPAR